MVARLMNVALGLWLMAAPDVLGHDGVAADNDHVCGPLAATFAMIALWEVTRPLRWANVAVGGWLVVASVLLPYPLAGGLNAAGVGLLLAALAFVQGRIRGQYGGGWSAAWRTGSTGSAPFVGSR